MTWDPRSPTEPTLVPLTDRMQRIRRSPEPTPEEVLLAREELEEISVGAPRRRLSEPVKRMLIWFSTDNPDRISRLIDWTLPIEEAYLIRRYLFAGHGMQRIADDVGVTPQGVGYRIRRSIGRLRIVQDLAWDIGERELRAAVGRLLAAKDTDILAAFWRERFSQSRTADALGLRQSTVRDAIVRVTAQLGGIVPLQRAKELKRLHATLVEVSRRQLWRALVPPAAWKAEKWKARRVRVPG